MEAAERAGAMVTEQIRTITGAAEQRAEEIRRGAEEEAEAVRQDARDAARRVLERIDQLEAAVQHLVVGLRLEADALTRLTKPSPVMSSAAQRAGRRTHAPLALDAGGAAVDSAAVADSLTEDREPSTPERPEPGADGEHEPPVEPEPLDETDPISAEEAPPLFIGPPHVPGEHAGPPDPSASPLVETDTGPETPAAPSEKTALVEDAESNLAPESESLAPEPESLAPAVSEEANGPPADGEPGPDPPPEEPEPALVETEPDASDVVEPPPLVAPLEPVERTALEGEVSELHDEAVEADAVDAEVDAPPRAPIESPDDASEQAPAPRPSPDAGQEEVGADHVEVAEPGGGVSDDPADEDRPRGRLRSLFRRESSVHNAPPAEAEDQSRGLGEQSEEVPYTAAGHVLQPGGGQDAEGEANQPARDGEPLVLENEAWPEASSPVVSEVEGGQFDAVAQGAEVEEGAGPGEDVEVESWLLPAEGDRPQHAEPGVVIEGYRLEGALGRQAGTGIVHLATDVSTAQAVAVKLLPAAVTDDEAGLQRFSDDVSRQSALDHPNIIKTLGGGTSSLGPFLIMELVAGVSLKSVILFRELGDREALDLLLPVAEALDFAVQRGMPHRDLTAQKIIVTREGEARAMLGDFGAGKPLQSSDDELPESVESFNYIAPERLRGDTLTAASNVYSLAAILFECLAGGPPFTDASARATAADTEPQSLTALRPDLGPTLGEVLRKGMSDDPSKRFSTAVELVRGAAHALDRAAVTGTDQPAPGLEG